MYLKSIEIQGFKSFMSKIVFQFHNGITAIVGPNGSGKSNVADAVRWVLGEQSARQLRGSSMQDVIFAGTETRRPLGFAAVSITLDNADHQLPVSFEEVTVTRRVYRSGESEYLLNGTQVRLRDINEIFYDTGIGKEGYSIIGQGQIDRILSDRPEERRELFDEAAGIVKFKRRKNAAQKKLDAERQNMVRVSDILAELTRQLGPLERQAKSARTYLEKREELKHYEVGLFLLEFSRIRRELEEAAEKLRITEEQLSGSRDEYEKTKAEYGRLEQEIGQMDVLLQEKRDAGAQGQLRGQQLENQIRILREQINTAHTSSGHIRTRIAAIGRQLAEFERQEQEAGEELGALRVQILETGGREAKASGALGEVRGEIAKLEQQIEQGKSEVINLLNQRAAVKARLQRYDTMLEQSQIRSAQLAQEALQLESEKSGQEALRREVSQEYEAASARIRELTDRSEQVGGELTELQQKLQEHNRQAEREQAEYHRESSRLESLKNIAERYDGYGGSIRRVMERREQEPGILGVVADIINVDREWEVAIETALGGSIQNIVTDTEETAKRQIEFLKQNRYGRATFLPLSGIRGKNDFASPQALSERGVVGLASDLVRTDPRYRELAASLLGRTLVVDHIDRAIALARKYRHTLRIVTREGELLNPGGAISGGAFKNSGNLLGRRREIEELERQVETRRAALLGLQAKIEEERDSRSRMRDELVELRDALQEGYLAQNTAKLRLDELDARSGSTDQSRQRIQAETGELEQQAREIRENQDNERKALAQSEQAEREAEQEILRQQELLEQKRGQEQSAGADAENIRLALSQLQQQEVFIRQNLARIAGEREKLAQEQEQHEAEIAGTSRAVREKEREIAALQEAERETASDAARIQTEIADLQAEREEKIARNKTFFAAREELSEQMNLLDRESFRLNAQLERLNEQKDSQIRYLWDEYQLTPGAAEEFGGGGNGSASSLKRSISAVKNEIRALGSVNVNAIEDYREVSERHAFLTAQYEDLQKAEEALLKIIAELDSGMRARFREQFACIQAEFDKAFRELFGGGRGTLELVEDEDILEAGIRIIAQPPGKKLQNMMQLSGGEKSLTAIALLFAIQNLKPSPFCLLDEIEAALDDSNVDRFARYLRRLSGSTQFIVITHRRGTMAGADRLYGITMQEKGVSTLVSVNLIEASLDD